MAAMSSIVLSPSTLTICFCTLSLATITSTHNHVSTFRFGQPKVMTIQRLNQIHVAEIGLHSQFHLCLMLLLIIYQILFTGSSLLRHYAVGTTPPLSGAVQTKEPPTRLRTDNTARIIPVFSVTLHSSLQSPNYAW